MNTLSNFQMSNHCYVPCVGKVGRVLAQENDIITVLFFTTLDDEVLGYDASNESIRDNRLENYNYEVWWRKFGSLDLRNNLTKMPPSFIYFLNRK